MTRRERTRHLIELGGLVAKAGLIELTDDDRAVMFGALVEIAGRLSGVDREQELNLWRRRGKRAFAADQPHAISDRTNAPLTEPSLLVNSSRC